jgi:hypothetical protein
MAVRDQQVEVGALLMTNLFLLCPPTCIMSFADLRHRGSGEWDVGRNSYKADKLGRGGGKFAGSLAGGTRKSAQRSVMRTVNAQGAQRSVLRAGNGKKLLERETALRLQREQELELVRPHHLQELQS